MKDGVRDGRDVGQGALLRWNVEGGVSLSFWGGELKRRRHKNKNTPWPLMEPPTTNTHTTINKKHVGATEGLGKDVWPGQSMGGA